MNQYQNPYYMVPQRRPRAWINGTLIILNILYFLYLELTGSTEDAYFMLEHGAMYGKSEVFDFLPELRRFGQCGFSAV